MFQFVVLMAPAATQGGKAHNPMFQLLPLFAILIIMYLLLIRPQSKRQKEQKTMLNKLDKGDRVLTAGGIIGTIVGVKEKENLLIVKIADNVKIEMTRSAVAQVLKDDTTPKL